MIALSCQHCGAPMTEVAARERPTLDCARCGAPDPLPPPVRLALLRYRGRLMREVERLRASALLGELTRELFGGGGCLQALFAGGLGLVALVAVGKWSVEQLPWAVWNQSTNGKLIASGVIMGGLLVAMVAVLLCATVPMIFATRRANARAREKTDALAFDEPTTCGSCGAPVRIPLWTEPSTLPCPFCSTPLLPPGAVAEGLEQMRGQAREAVIEQGEQRLAGAVGISVAELREGDKPPDVAGPFEASASSGHVYVCDRPGLRAFASTQVLPEGTLLQVEVSVDLPVEGTLWLVPPNGRHEACASLLGPSVPDPRAFELRSHRLLAEPWADASLLRSHAALARALAELHPRESLRIDPAGLSWWRLNRGGFSPANTRSESWIAKRGEDALALVDALRASSGVPATGARP